MLTAVEPPDQIFDLCVAPEELERRSARLILPQIDETVSGYRRLYVRHVLQADAGCDFDFMLAGTLDEVAPTRPSNARMIVPGT